ncbi:PAS domain-containing sensor histidine kinase [Scytonema hofmannii PCC 7110]|uniref:Circadian input-output histidine kinase CikA n=1 Tax=Scytonema hofmannii PCC 7110 TaxID=128403 RepID=A0A139XAP0_9CYAN|nr:PAS domain-containing sensor histidine kinase [Scytonema hofmannii]KYC41713.1 PAS domain-containing sensor histidine kinase [Scytonema hofmannii PCC 7110]
MNLENFGRQVHEVRRHTQLLQYRVRESPEGQQDLLSEAFEELRTALEELHVAEEELRLQNEQLAIACQEAAIERRRYQELFDFAPDGYLVTDAQGKIWEANHAAANLLKISKNFLIGKPLVNFCLQEDRRVFRSQLQRLIDMEEMQEWEIQLQPRKGSKFDASLTVKTIRDNEGKPTGWRWLIRDITSRKQVEEKLKIIQIQNLKLQEASRFKSQLLGVISHELRTPMNTILGFSQLLLRRYYHLLAPELREMVERIIHSGKHLLKLIEEILDFCKLETNKVELNLQEFNLVELVTRITEDLRPLAKRKNLALVLHLNIENPNMIIDCDRLQQVFVNLLSNAIKFTDIGGVFVEVQQVKGEPLVLMVKDTGIGIPESDIPHIFSEFWQVDKSTTRKQGGVGLGLAIVDKLVRLMKGTITVESKLGEGSTFRVELPVTSDQ